jgi:hypothetical protein
MLEAFLRLKHRQDVFLPVITRGGALAGVVTAHDIDRWLQDNDTGVQRTLEMPAGQRVQMSPERLAA